MKLTMEHFQKPIYSLADLKCIGVKAADDDASQILSELAGSLMPS